MRIHRCLLLIVVISVVFYDSNIKKVMELRLAVTNQTDGCSENPLNNVLIFQAFLGRKLCSPSVDSINIGLEGVSQTERWWSHCAP